MSNIIDAKYVSIWDDGATEVWSDVEVDLDEMAITGWDEDSKTYVGYAPADDGELDIEGRKTNELHRCNVCEHLEQWRKHHRN